MSDMREVTLICPGCGTAKNLMFSPYSPIKAIQCSACGQRIPLPHQSTSPSPAQQSETSAPAQLTSLPKRGGLAGRLIAGLVGGFILATLAANLCTTLLGDFRQDESSAVTLAIAGIVFFILLTGAIVMGLRAERAAKTWRRLLISSGIVTLAIPLAALAPTFRAASEATARGSDIEAVAYGAGGTMAAIVMWFFSILLATIFLTIGLLVGRDRNVGPS